MHILIVLTAGITLAVDRVDPKSAGAGVKVEIEVLWRSSNTNLSKISHLEITEIMIVKHLCKLLIPVLALHNIYRELL